MLSDELIARGHNVSWLTTDFQHSLKRYRENLSKNSVENLNIVLIHVPRYRTNTGLDRIMSHVVYGWGVTRELRKLHKSAAIDMVVTSIPPIFSSYAAMKFCVNEKVPGAIDMQDAWPHILELGIPPSVRRIAHATLIKGLEKMVSVAANSASGLVAVSSDYLGYLSQYRTNSIEIPKVIFPLGFDARILDLDSRKSSLEIFSEPFVVSYIGSFGRFYDLETVIYAADICRERGVQFILIGDGPKYNSLIDLAKRLNLTNVHFKGRMPFDNAVLLLRQSHASLVPITGDWPPNIPNKVYDYLFLGLPMIFSIKGQVKATLSENGLGLYYEAGNAKSLADNIALLDSNRELLIEMRKSGTAYLMAEGDGDRIYRQYSGFLETLSKDG